MHVTFGSAIADFFKGYVTFSGRSTRAQFWWVQLFLAIIGFVLGIANVTTVMASISAYGNSMDYMMPFSVASGFSIIGLLINLALFLPSLALWMRRLHDIGRPGWWTAVFIGVIAVGYVLYFVGLINIIRNSYGGPSIQWVAVMLLAFGLMLAAGIINIVWMCKPSEPDNEYGPNPFNSTGSQYTDTYGQGYPYN